MPVVSRDVMPLLIRDSARKLLDMHELTGLRGERDVDEQVPQGRVDKYGTC